MYKLTIISVLSSFFIITTKKSSINEGNKFKLKIGFIYNKSGNSIDQYSCF